MKVRDLIHTLIEHDPSMNIYVDNGDDLINLLDTEERRVVIKGTRPGIAPYNEYCIAITLGDPR